MTRLFGEILARMTAELQRGMLRKANVMAISGLNLPAHEMGFLTAFCSIFSCNYWYCETINNGNSDRIGTVQRERKVRLE